MDIDPNVLNIVLGLFTNGLTSLIASSGHKAGELLIGKEFQEKWEIEKTALSPLLHSAITDVAETVEWKGQTPEEIVSLFLLSPEVEDIVRQIYSTELAEDRTDGTLRSIHKIFLSLFIQFVGSYPSDAPLKEDNISHSVNLLFDALVTGCNLVLNNAIDKGIIAAHNAQSAFRHNIIASEIHAIQKKLDFLLESEKTNIQDILDFEKKYRQQVGHRFSSITPPNFDSAQKVPLKDVYVCPHIGLSHKRDFKGESTIVGYRATVLTTEVFLSHVYRAVLLGDPGGGKSTFTFKLCYDLATTRYSERWFAGRTQLTPIRVVLRDYGASKKSRHWSILEFIEAEAKATYQLRTPPSGTFEYLLLNGRVMIIFDDLDELLDTHSRQEIRSDVESFCHFYPSVPVLVTSREIGYEQASLDEELFEVFHLSSFDEKQVQEYAEKWFKVADLDLAPKQQQAKVGRFLQESEIVPDLRSNPLMLALICNIYHGENYIPRNRPEVYRKCSVVLFERWDQSRDIHVALPFEAHLRPAMMYLAYWIYENEALQTGVTEKKLMAKTADYLCLRRFNDRDEAEQAASEFIGFCKGRGWVFTDVGTLKDGERLYQFTHQTFLEYFAAEYLVRTHPTPDRLIHALQSRIMKREWDVVAQLAFQIQDKNVENAGDELLTSLLEQSRKIEGIEGWGLFSFAVRCLAFIVASPKVTRSITERCIHFFFTVGREQIEGTTLPNSLSHLLDLEEREDFFRDLLCAATENRVGMAGILETFLVGQIMRGEEPEALLAVEVALGLTRTLNSGSGDPIYFWDTISKRIFTSCSSQIELLSQKYFLMCYYGILQGKVSITNLVRWHGVESIFHDYAFNIYPGLFYASIARNLIRRTIDAFEGRVQHQEDQNLPGLLQEVGEILLCYKPPWTKNQLGPWNIFENLEIVNPHKNILRLDSRALFGAFTLFAVLVERSSNDEIIQIKRSRRHSFLAQIRWLLLARFIHVSESKVRSEMERSGFSTDQRDIIQRWVQREIDLVQ